MANIFWDTAGSNTSPYDTQAKAATTLAAALAVASTGDTVFASHTLTQALTADATYSPPSGVRIMSVDYSSGATPTTATAGASLSGVATAGVDIAFDTGPAYLYGLTLTSGGSSTTGSIRFANSDNSFYELDTCTVVIGNSNSSSLIGIGTTTAAQQATVVSSNCTFTWGGTGQGFSIGNVKWTSIRDDLCGGATVPTTLMESIAHAVELDFFGSDFSDIAGTVFEDTPSKPFQAHLWACPMHASTTVFSPTIASSGDVYLHDCAAGDVHYAFQHWHYSGNTISSTAYSASGGAKYDGTNGYAWVITGTNATPARPYYSPWVEVYHSGTSAITPTVEAVRDGSATKYNNDVFWSDWLYKGTSGSVRASYTQERNRASSAALNTGDLGAGDWTGEGGTAAFMKFQPPSSITPAEIGQIAMRIACTSNATIIVDPFIRNLS